MKKDVAFSGLEAAIVLIAFVVVAAVFSYVMLGAGFFATQKSQEVTYSGIKQATSNMVLDGSLYGSMVAGETLVHTITFYMTIPEGGQPQSLADVDYTVTVNNVKYKYVVGTPASGQAEFQVANVDSPLVTLLQPGNNAKMELRFNAATTNSGPASGQVGS